MENNEQEQPIEQAPVVEEAVEQVAEEVVEEAVAKPVDDRPEINYKMELERRKAEAENLRRELDAERAKQVKRYDPNDLSTWTENDLRAVKNTQDPQYLHLKEQAEEILLERKFQAIRERERVNEKRATAEMELRTKYPEAMDSVSDFARAMERVMFDLDLQKSPAGRLAAARIVAGERSKGSSVAKAAGRKQEEARLKDVKQTLSEGDRPDPRQNMTNPKREQEILSKLNGKNLDDQGSAMNEILKSRGLDRNNFFKK